MPSQVPAKSRHLTRTLFFIFFTISSKEAHAWKTRETWESLAKRTGTDKVTTHAYEKIYEMWLAPWRHEAVNFLEIGLGCDMTYGPGKSLSLWEEYFTHRDARVSFLEVDGVCVKNHDNIKLRNGTIFVGSQEDESVLRNIAAEGHAVGGYDVIVDDGGHTMKQQLTSLKVLWPAVSSGGLYVIEDLQTSYMPYVSLLLYLNCFPLVSRCLDSLTETQLQTAADVRQLSNHFSLFVFIVSFVPLFTPSFTQQYLH